MKKTFLIFSVIMICVLVYLKLSNTVIVVAKSNKALEEKVFFQDLVKPLQNVEANDEITIFITFDRLDRMELPSDLPNTNCLKLKRKKIGDFAKEAWTFKETDGDMATVSSKLFIFKNNKLLFKSGIVISDSIIGLQHKNYGWLEPVHESALRTVLLDFKPVQFPIVII